MKYNTLAATLALGLSLGGCGGGGTGAASAPSPTPGPTPTPASYTKISDIQGSHTFQTAGVSYTPTDNGFTNPTAQQFGSGVTVGADGAGNYTLKTPGNLVQTFMPADVVAGPAGAATYQNSNGATVGRFTYAVPLTYTVVGTWSYTHNGAATAWLAVGGSSTLPSDMPKSGTATYNVTAGGGANSGGTVYTLSTSTASFTANFGNGTVQTSLALSGPAAGGTGAPINLGSFTGNGTINSGSPGFAGTLTGAQGSGIFSGAFFGPQALEMGFGWVVNGSGYGASGVAYGTKQ